MFSMGWLFTWCLRARLRHSRNLLISCEDFSAALALATLFAFGAGLFS
jgi:hypothetical protein